MFYPIVFVLATIITLSYAEKPVQCWEIKNFYNTVRLSNGNHGCCGKPNSTIDSSVDCFPTHTDLPKLSELGLSNRYFNYQDQSWDSMEYGWTPSFTQTANMELNELVAINVPQYRENSTELYYTTTRHAIINKQKKTWGLETAHVIGALERFYRWLSKNGINFVNPIWSARNNEKSPHMFKVNETNELELSNAFVDSSWLYAQYIFESGGSNPPIDPQNDVCPRIPSPDKISGGAIEIYLKPEHTKYGKDPEKCKIIVSFDHDAKVTIYNQVIVHEIPIVKEKISGNHILMKEGSIHLHVESLLVQKYTTEYAAKLLEVHTEFVTKKIDIDMHLATVYIDRNAQEMKRTKFQDSNALLQEESTFAIIKTESARDADCEFCENGASVTVQGTKVPARNVHRTDIFPNYYNGFQFELFGKGYPHGAMYHFWSMNGMFDNGFVSMPSVFSTFSDNTVSISKEHYAGASPYHNTMVSPITDSFGRTGDVRPSDKVLLGPNIMVHEGMHDVQYSTYGAMSLSRGIERSFEMRKLNDTDKKNNSYTSGYFVGFGSEATAIYTELMSDVRMGDLIYQLRGLRYKKWIQAITYGKSLNGSRSFFGGSDDISWPMYVFLGGIFDKDIQFGPFSGDKLRTLIKNLYKHIRGLDDEVLLELGQAIHLVNSYSNNPFTSDNLTRKGIPEYLDKIEPTKILDQVVRESSKEVGKGDHGLSHYFDYVVVGTVLMANKESAPMNLSQYYNEYVFDDEVPLIKSFSKSVKKPDFGKFHQLGEQAFTPNNNPYPKTNLDPYTVARENENNWNKGRIMEEVISGDLMMNMLNEVYKQNGEFEIGKEYKADFPLPQLSAYCFGIGRGFEVTREEIRSANGSALVYPNVNATGEITYVSEPEHYFDIQVLSEECPLCELKGVKYSVFSRGLNSFNGYLGRELKEQDFLKIEMYDRFNKPLICVTNAGPKELTLNIKVVAPPELCPLGLCGS
tara:strand:+ start:963 stop:3878 length:2916 start_codon:yes stop_codon:yes gene_type:complete